MSRPSVSRSQFGSSELYSMRVPENTIKNLLIDIATKLANSDDAIQYAVKVAKEAEEGGVTDSTYDSFRYSVGIVGGTYFSLWRKEAVAFADEFCELLHGDEEERLPEVLQDSKPAVTETTNGGI